MTSSKIVSVDFITFRNPYILAKTESPTETSDKAQVIRAFALWNLQPLPAESDYVKKAPRLTRKY